MTTIRCCVDAHKVLRVTGGELLNLQFKRMGCDCGACNFNVAATRDEFKELLRTNRFLKRGDLQTHLSDARYLEIRGANSEGEIMELKVTPQMHRTILSQY